MERFMIGISRDITKNFTGLDRKSRIRFVNRNLGDSRRDDDIRKQAITTWSRQASSDIQTTLH